MYPSYPYSQSGFGYETYHKVVPTQSSSALPPASQPLLQPAAAVPSTLIPARFQNPHVLVHKSKVPKTSRQTPKHKPQLPQQRN
ncbi:uncharacterized protein EAF01_009407 [Botrytis porri]|uniref:uncharacterized protein n=1 Tax=Botrytis porri TaxID=87229 RepID=UPI0018FFD6ED|nr:uncharacterized protein EAF01_009407 [Botrytis porri]KAF7895445.1 hypothetical protein EAF01_009407 [Botrytis porri]